MLRRFRRWLGRLVDPVVYDLVWHLESDINRLDDWLEELTEREATPKDIDDIIDWVHLLEIDIEEAGYHRREQRPIMMAKPVDPRSRGIVCGDIGGGVEDETPG